ncbi:MAG: hypothetical protein WBC98_07395, partial [Candidatus Zixiibacteriota bacterium]
MTGKLLSSAIVLIMAAQTSGLRDCLPASVEPLTEKSALEQGNAPSVADRTGKSVGDFLTPERRVDLEKIRKSGYQGRLNWEGYHIQLDPITGEPTIRSQQVTSSKDDPDDVYWDNTVSPSIPGVDGYVYAMTTYNGLLIIGGSFNAAGDVRADNIASWDGSSWSALGSGTNDQVQALTVYGSQLIVGGWFTTAGGVAAGYIASWDGSSWSTLGAGMDNTVRALTVYDSKLIAGGWFTTAGGVAADYIASWDGSSWSTLGSGMSGEPYADVYSLVVYDSKLIAGGVFTAAGGVPANKIASWDGSDWSALGTGMDYNVRALTVYDSKLIAGG